jgi:aldose 1-epimerase
MAAAGDVVEEVRLVEDAAAAAWSRAVERIEPRETMPVAESSEQTPVTQRLSRRAILDALLKGAVTAAVPGVSTMAVYGQSGTQESRGAGGKLPTGTQHELVFETQRLVITQVGAGIRIYQVDGVDVIDGFPETSAPTAARGMVLAPWPGRVEGGKYVFRGEAYQLPLGPNANVAMHGLVRSVDWQVTEKRASEITLQHVIEPTTGYPFEIELSITYQLGRAGMAVRSKARNRGAKPAPFGIGWHPYFTVGTPRIDANLLEVPAARYIPRNNGVSTPPAVSVAGTQWDFRKARPIGEQVFGDACNYEGLARDAAGIARATLRDGSRQITVWMDRTTDYITVYTGPDRRSLAIEPCTCPSGALNTGIGLVTLTPSQSFENRWGAESARVI